MERKYNAENEISGCWNNRKVVYQIIRNEVKEKAKEEKGLQLNMSGSEQHKDVCNLTGERGR